MVCKSSIRMVREGGGGGGGGVLEIVIVEYPLVLNENGQVKWSGVRTSSLCTGPMGCSTSVTGRQPVELSESEFSREQNKPRTINIPLKEFYKIT